MIFLFSNNIIYKRHYFLGTEKINSDKLYELQKQYQMISTNIIDDDYFVDNLVVNFSVNTMLELLEK